MSKWNAKISRKIVKLKIVLLLIYHQNNSLGTRFQSVSPSKTNANQVLSLNKNIRKAGRLKSRGGSNKRKLQKRSNFGSGDLSTIYNNSDKNSNSNSIYYQNSNHDSRIFDNSFTSKQANKIGKTINNKRGEVMKYLNQTQRKGFHLNHNLESNAENHDKK